MADSCEQAQERVGKIALFVTYVLTEKHCIVITYQ